MCLAHTILATVLGEPPTVYQLSVNDERCKVMIVHKCDGAVISYIAIPHKAHGHIGPTSGPHRGNVIGSGIPSTIALHNEHIILWL